MKESHVERFDDVSKYYMEDLNNTLKLAGGDGEFFYHQKIKFISSHLKKKPKIILDFGCAIGALTNLLASYFTESKVIGYDPAAECVAIAAKAHAHLKNLQYISDITKLTEKPDLVVIAGVMHHIPKDDKQGILDQVYQNLAPGGHCIVFEHNPFNPLTRIIVSKSELDKGATLVSCPRMQKMFKTAQFKEVKPHYVSYFPPYLKALLPLEPALEKIPLGAQYAIIGTK